MERLRELHEFFRWPWSDVRITNDVTQARDFLALEVTFLNLCRSSLALGLAAAAVYFRRLDSSEPDTAPFELAMVFALAAVAVITPLVALYNYIHAIVGFRNLGTRFSNTDIFWVFAIVAVILALILNSYQYTVQGDSLGDMAIGTA
ncbi:hypothetical protein B9G98_00340 [Wickerhamiella sorbophila]|uniref:DUF202 domain-containing protein n=1 Tax=Wickerhamiella sorbophila TaxID=45607 RepID=A0A2T0FCM9_9ASCO|nr:hypothetical protein B9G98_00340 [Wickerhamiella sorbophila]PRT52720.1 hypothetical protein B9G98_00340 [Wickerhamiella sorbophila]